MLKLNNTRNIHGQPCPVSGYEIRRKDNAFL